MQINQLPSNCKDRLADLEARILKKPKVEILEAFQRGDSFEVFSSQKERKLPTKQLSLQGTPRKSSSDQTLFRQLQITQFTKNMQRNKNYNNNNFDLNVDELQNAEQTLKEKLNAIAIQDIRIKELEARVTELNQELQEQKEQQFKSENAIKQFVIEVDQFERMQLIMEIERNKEKLGEYSYQREKTQIQEVWVDGKEIKQIKEKVKLIENQKEEIENKKKQFQFQSSSQYLKYVLLSKEQQLLQEQLSRLENERQIFIKQLRRQYDEEHARFKKINEYRTIGERYVLLQLLGRGGFSEVYKGYDLKELKYVACKIHQLNPDWSVNSKSNYVKHATREYKVHRELLHPNIVKLYDSVEIDMNTFCTVLEYCDGCDLSIYIKRYKQFQEKEAKLIIQQILNAIKYIHQSNIIHYDIKPQNILFHQNEIKLSDFGLCKVVDNDKSKMELTSQGVGTYWYLPPECFYTGDQPPNISNKVDIWSLGVIFYEMLYGMKPFGQGYSQETILKEKIILKSECVNFPTKPIISNECKDFIKGCLNYSQAERFDVVQACNHQYMQQRK
ncbi:unnamed protein product [Paramecium primaurelia]|uniref:Protein kinase domain-containing protein n=1 Tax=Paramecium primaurelia TaxID=5886 RepID=A0A8S1LXL4_PARPR|nr:unnamed protein product [Paramecium primaurelia]